MHVIPQACTQICLAVFTIATCPNPTDLAPTLRSPGRLDQIIKLQALGLAERQSLLSHAIKQRGMKCSPELIKVRLRNTFLFMTRCCYTEQYPLLYLKTPITYLNQFENSPGTKFLKPQNFIGSSLWWIRFLSVNLEQE